MHALVANGREQWFAGVSFELEQRALEWFAVELNRAGWWRRQLILWRIRRRLTAIVRRNEPSTRTMW